MKTSPRPARWRAPRSWILCLLLALPASALDRVVVLATNDTHGQLFPTEAPEDLGGLARRATLIKQARAEAAARGKGFLLLDAGDINTGTRVSDEAKGLWDARAMTRLGYHGVAVGNHEFDLLPADLQAFREASGYPLLSANVRDLEGQRVFRPWVIEEQAGRRIALVGLTTAETPETSTFGRDYPYLYLDPGDELELALGQLHAAEPDLDAVVVISHCGVHDEGEMITRFGDRVTAWVGGHTHSPEVRRLSGGGVYLRAGSKGRWVGRFELWFTGDRVRAVAPRRIPIDASIPDDPDMVAFLPDRATSPVLTVAAGSFSKAIPGIPARSSTLGNLVADALRVEGQVDVAVTNRGGLRRPLPAGPLTRDQVYAVCPFRNQLWRYRLTADQLRAVFREAASFGTSAPGFLEVSGAEVTVRGDQVDLRVGGQPVREGETYVLGISDFLAKGGDGFTVFAGFPAPDPLDVPPAEMLAAHVARHSTLTPDPRPRIMIREVPSP